MPTAYSQWIVLPDGPNERVRALCYDSLNGRLYAFGRFLEAGGMVVNGTTYLENELWHPMGDGVDNVFVFSVRDAHYKNDSVMISGSFSSMIGVPNTYRIALWNGTVWQSIGGDGGNGNARGMLANEDGWTLVGPFTQMGGIPSHGIARYHNGNWEDQCAYPDNSGWRNYSAVAKYQENYVIGGNINDFPGINEIGVLVNDTLRPMGSGIVGDPWVNDLKVYDGKLFVAGEFYAGWGNPGSGLMTWDGENWNDPIPGVQCATQVYDLDIFDGKLFLSSYMLLSGSADFYTLAMYTPNEICLFGKNLTAAMHPIAGVPNGLFVAPNYPDLVVDGDSLRRLAFYDITQGFDTCIALPVGLNPMYRRDEPRLNIYPNPNSGIFQVDLPGKFRADRIVMYGPLGNEIGLDSKNETPNAGKISVDLQSKTPGVYFVRVCGDDGTTCLTGRVIVQ